MSESNKTISQMIEKEVTYQYAQPGGGSRYRAVLTRVAENTARQAAWKALQLSYLKRDSSDGAMFQAQSWCDQAVAAVMGGDNE